VKKSLEIKLQQCIERIKYFQKKIKYTASPYKQFFYNELIKIELKKIKQLTDYNCLNKREFTLEELAEYDGSAGKPAYTAVNGIVYDVSLEKTWGGGTHFGLYAGKELTDSFFKCHENEEILKGLPVVGILKK
jgi:predicted heme/steroid binding protein